MDLSLLEPAAQNAVVLSQHAKTLATPPAGFVIYAGGLFTGAVYMAWWRVKQLYRHREHDHRLDVIRRRFHAGEISLAEAEHYRKRLQGD